MSWCYLLVIRTPRVILFANVTYFWIMQRQPEIISFLTLFAIRFFFGLVVSPAHFFSLVEGSLDFFLSVFDKQ